jgi:hypothetical protein
MKKNQYVWLTLLDLMVWIGFACIVIFALCVLSCCTPPAANPVGSSTSVLRCSVNGCFELDGTVCWNGVVYPNRNSGSMYCEDEQGNEYFIQSSCMCWIQEQ